MRIHVLIVCLTMLCTGCIMGEIRFDDVMTVGEVYDKPLKECRVLFLQFEHPTYQKVKETSVAVGTFGGKGYAGTESKEQLITDISYIPPMEAVSALEDTEAFKSIVTYETDHDLILTGRLASESWMHLAAYLQIPVMVITLGTFHCVFPTLPVCGEVTCELRLTDKEGNLIKKVRTVARRTDYSTLWALGFLLPANLGNKMLARENLETVATNHAISELVSEPPGKQ